MAGQDKLLAEVAGRPLLAWTAGRVRRAPRRSAGSSWSPRPDRVAVAVGRAVAGPPRSSTSSRAAIAGRRRSRPAFDALADAPDERVLLVHDGARPLVSGRTIAAVAAATRDHGAAIPVLPVAETLKRIDGAVVAGTVDRTSLAAAQTPQGVTVGVLRAAYRRFPPEGPETWTDEASLLEACTIPVHAVPGDPDNLKVTLPADLARASYLLGERRLGRHGIGHDSHPFGPGTGLALGGIVIADAPRLYGHSDGDVALHAVCDALLGAAGLGDLGRLFPAGPETPRDIASAALLAEVRQRVESAGWQVTSVDVTIVAARPRLGSYLDAMRDATADLLGLARDAVNVKASTGNLDGSEGAGRSISALATASVESRQ